MLRPSCHHAVEDITFETSYMADHMTPKILKHFTRSTALEFRPSSRQDWFPSMVAVGTLTHSTDNAQCGKTGCEDRL